MDMGSQLQNKNLGKHVLAVIEAAADPGVEEYTRRVGVHNVIDMALFLKVLGAQTLQLTIKNKGVAITSWILRPLKTRWSISRLSQEGQSRDTINMELDLDDFEFGEARERTIIDDIRIVGKMLASNRGIKKQPNMMRLFMAGGIESLVGYVRTTGQTRQD